MVVIILLSRIGFNMPLLRRESEEHEERLPTHTPCTPSRGPPPLRGVALDRFAVAWVSVALSSSSP